MTSASKFVQGAFRPVVVAAPIQSTRRPRKCLAGLLVATVLSVVAPHSRADCGPQQKKDCGGVCCGSTNSGPNTRINTRTNSGPSAYQLRVEAENRVIDENNRLNHLGWDAYHSGDHLTALKYFQQAVDGDQDNFKPFQDAVRMARSAIADDSGRAAFDRGDFATALSYFQQALALYPHDIYRGQVEAVLGAMASQSGNEALALKHYKNAYGYDRDNGLHQNIVAAEAELQRRKDAAQRLAATTQADSKIQTSIRDLEQPLAKAAPTVKGLAFDDGSHPDKQPAPARPAVPADQEVATGAFGIKIAQPHLPAAKPAGTIGTDTRVGDQLLSAAAASKPGDRSDLAPNYDATSTPQGNGSLVYQGKPTDLPAFAAQIPSQYRDDAVVHESLARYQHLDGRRADVQAQIASIEKQQREHSGDPQVLAAQLADRTQADANLKQQQDQAKADIRKQLKLKNFDFDFHETPPTSKPVGQ